MLLPDPGENANGDPSAVAVIDRLERLAARRRARACLAGVLASAPQGPLHVVPHVAVDWNDLASDLTAWDRQHLRLVLQTGSRDEATMAILSPR